MRISYLLGVASVVTTACTYPSLPPLPASDAQTEVDAPAEQEIFRSCQSLGDICGPSGNDSCCTSLDVPGGTFFRGYDSAGDSSSGTADAPATVSSFRLDKYEITVGRFRAFVMAGKGTQVSPPLEGEGTHPHIPNSGWRSQWNSLLMTDQAMLLERLTGRLSTWTPSPGDNEARPINGIMWNEALAFCIWDGGYLPTEAELNYAAVGGSEQRAYPWSAPPGALWLDSSYASYSDGTDCMGDGLAGCAVTDFVRVGSKAKGNGRWGHADLAGNVQEWTLDASEPYQVPCNDCARVEGQGSRRLLGGNYGASATSLRPKATSGTFPSYREPENGARCARPAK